MNNLTSMLKYSLIAILCFWTINQSLFAQCPTNQNDYYFTHENHSYVLVNEAKTWLEAANCAAEMGGYLVEINNETEQDSIYSAILKSGLSDTYTVVNDGGEIAYVWIGASDIAEEGVWLWDGSFTIDLEDVFKEINVNISDIKGQVVFENIYTYSSLINIDTPLIPGMYFVKVDFDGFSSMLKFMRE